MKNFIASVFTAFIVLAIATILIGATYVPVGKQAMVKNKLNGDITLIDQSGMTFVFPFVNSVHKVSVAEQSYDYKDTANTKDSIQATYSMTINAKVDDVNKFYSRRFTLTDKDMYTVINSELTKSLDRVSNKYQYSYIKSNVASIGNEVRDDVNKELKGYGLEVKSVSIKGFDAPESVEKAIQDKISKEQQAKATKYDVEKAENESKAQKIKQDSVSEEQQQMELCDKAIAKGAGNSPACYFGDKTYVVSK